MPNRILKESICYSEDLDKLKPFEEVVFYRLIVNCDDYGRIDARPTFLKSKLFVTRQGITLQNIDDAIRKLASVGLVNLYEVDEKPFLLFPKWEFHQVVRAKKSKYPAPDNICKQMISDDGECFRNPIQSESNPNTYLDPISERGFSMPVEEKVREWLRYKAERRESYKPTGLKSLLTEIHNNIKKYSEDDVIELISKSMSSNWAGIIWDRLKSTKPQPSLSDSKNNSRREDIPFA